MERFLTLVTNIVENRLAVVVVVIMCVMGALAHHVAKANATFSHAYLVYAAAADDADMAVYVPTANNNPVRAELNTILIQILGNKMPDAERLAKARQGLELLRVSQTQIDQITPKLDAARTAIEGMEKSLSPVDAIFQRGDPQKIIASAKDRAEATSDIRALSYRANLEMQKIFQHFVDAKGTLANSYVNQLNNDLPAIEDEFNRRQNRYRDLQTDFDEIRMAYKDFTSVHKSTR